MQTELKVRLSYGTQTEFKVRLHVKITAQVSSVFVTFLFKFFLLYIFMSASWVPNLATLPKLRYSKAGGTITMPRVSNIAATEGDSMLQYALHAA